VGITVLFGCPLMNYFKIFEGVTIGELRRMFPKTGTLRSFILKLGNNNRRLNLELTPPIGCVAVGGDVYLVSNPIVIRLRLVNGRVYAYDSEGLLDEVRRDEGNDWGYKLPEFIYRLLKPRLYINRRVVKVTVKFIHLTEFAEYVGSWVLNSAKPSSDGRKVKFTIPL